MTLIGYPDDVRADRPEAAGCATSPSPSRPASTSRSSATTTSCGWRHIVGGHWPPAGLRHEMLEEAVEIIIRALWAGGAMTAA